MRWVCKNKTTGKDKTSLIKLFIMNYISLLFSSHFIDSYQHSRINNRKRCQEEARHHINYMRFWLFMWISTLGGVEESPLKLLREVTTVDKIRKYRVDCNNNPPIGVSFMSPKLTVFFQFQEFIFRNPTVDYSTSSVCRSRTPWKQKSEVPWPGMKLYVSIYILMGHLSLQKHILTHHTLKHFVY
jgi:hypothetical protein